jgi:hypothetical protein
MGTELKYIQIGNRKLLLCQLNILTIIDTLKESNYECKLITSRDYDYTQINFNKDNKYLTNINEVNLKVANIEMIFGFGICKKIEIIDKSLNESNKIYLIDNNGASISTVDKYYIYKLLYGNEEVFNINADYSNLLCNYVRFYISDGLCEIHYKIDKELQREIKRYMKAICKEYKY